MKSFFVVGTADYLNPRIKYYNKLTTGTSNEHQQGAPVNNNIQNHLKAPLWFTGLFKYQQET